MAMKIVSRSANQTSTKPDSPSPAPERRNVRDSVEGMIVSSLSIGE